MALKRINNVVPIKGINFQEVGANTKQYYLPDLMDRFIKYKKACNVKERTLQDYTKYFNEFLKHVPSTTLSYEQLKESVLHYLTSKSGKAPATYNIPYSNLNAFFNWAVDIEGVLTTNPIKQLKLKKIRDEGKIREINQEDLRKFMSHIDIQTYAGFRDYTLIVLTMDTGIRPKEACDITEDMFDFNNKVLYLPNGITKDREYRRLPLSSQTVDLVSRLISFKDPSWDNKVFHCYDGKSFTPRQWIKRMYKYSRKFGIKISPYDLRHTFAIMFLRNNGNLFALQEILGHSDIEMTKRYCKLAFSDLENQHTIASPIADIVKRTTRIRRLFG